jgi:hypothetical protein
METPAFPLKPDIPLGEALVAPFEPLTLTRPMLLFPTALGLKPGETKMPSEDFLANLTSGRRSFQAIFRDLFGKDFRNFLNYSLGKRKTTPEVYDRLLTHVGGTPQMLDLLATSVQPHSDAPTLRMLYRTGEGALFRFINTVLSMKTSCPNCGGNLITDPAAWWSEQPCDLAPPEWRFADRILYDLIASHWLSGIFKQRTPDSVYAGGPVDLCLDGRHPFGHWIDAVMRPYKARTIGALPARAGAQTNEDSLYRIARGETLTVEVIDDLTANLPENTRDALRRLDRFARVIAFVIDFLAAAHRGDDALPQDIALRVVKQRMSRLPKTSMPLQFSRSD